MAQLQRFAKTVPLVIAALAIVKYQREANAGLATGHGGNSSNHLSFTPSQRLMDGEMDFVTLGGRQRLDGVARSPRKRNRESKFISFETKNNNIEVEIDFAIPFLTIPVKKSIDGVMSSVEVGSPLLNVNVGAIALAGVLALGGALIGGVTRLFRESPMFTPFNTRRDSSDDIPSKSERDADAGQNALWSILQAVDRNLQQYDIDTTACTQRTVCWYVKEAMTNVREQRASRLDTVLDGLSRSDWALKFTTGTAIEDAISTGRRSLNCEQAFPACRLGPEMVQRLMRKHARARN